MTGPTALIQKLERLKELTWPKIEVPEGTRPFEILAPVSAVSADPPPGGGDMIREGKWTKNGHQHDFGEPGFIVHVYEQSEHERWWWSARFRDAPNAGATLRAWGSEETEEAVKLKAEMAVGIFRLTLQALDVQLRGGADGA